MGSVASLPLSPEIYSCCTENCGTYQLRNRRITNTRIIPTIFFIELRLLLINCFICCHLVSSAAIIRQTDNTNALGKNSRTIRTAIAVITIANTIIDLICGGVVERFPDLKFVVAEYETGWVGHFKQRLDHAAYRTPWELADGLTMKPSEYFDRNLIEHSFART